jgi:hypothetical protein
MSDQIGAFNAASSNKLRFSVAEPLLLGSVLVLTLAWIGVLIWLGRYLFEWLFN